MCVETNKPNNVYEMPFENLLKIIRLTLHKPIILSTDPYRLPKCLKAGFKIEIVFY